MNHSPEPPQSPRSETQVSPESEPIEPKLDCQPASVTICQFRSCTRSGSAEVLEAFQTATSDLDIKVCGTGCMGQCGSGPTVLVMPDQTWYCRVQPEDVPRIVEQHLQGGERVQSLLHPRFHPRFDMYR